jgi:hypothetical protein
MYPQFLLVGNAIPSSARTDVTCTAVPDA